MRKEDIEKLDKLREEKRSLENFISGNGTFGMRTESYRFIKFFGCGTHELYTSKKLTERFKKILDERLTEINNMISDI